MLGLFFFSVFRFEGIFVSFAFGAIETLAETSDTFNQRCTNFGVQGALGENLGGLTRSLCLAGLNVFSFYRYIVYNLVKGHTGQLLGIFLNAG